MPMAIDLGTTIRCKRADADVVELVSDHELEPAVIPLTVSGEQLRGIRPGWARYVAGVVHQLRPSSGLTGTITTTLPVGAGLSSSAALEVAAALALGFDGDAVEMALLCQRAEHLATGVPCGVMDQWASAGGVDGAALLMDFTSLTLEPVPMPEGAAVVVVDSGQRRTLVDSAYAERRASCERAATTIGPLRAASIDDLDAISDPTDARRARHVLTENARVREFADALRAGDLAAAGSCMVRSHHSLGHDFDVSTPVLDDVVDRLIATPGVHGARLTGAGFGGCVVALTDHGVLDTGWTVRPSRGAHLR